MDGKLAFGRKQFADVRLRAEVKLLHLKCLFAGNKKSALVMRVAITCTGQPVYNAFLVRNKLVLVHGQLTAL